MQKGITSKSNGPNRKEKKKIDDWFE